MQCPEEPAREQPECRHAEASSGPGQVGHAVYEIASGVTDYTPELLIGDQVVPQSIEEQHVRLA